MNNIIFVNDLKNMYYIITKIIFINCPIDLYDLVLFFK